MDIHQCMTCGARWGVGTSSAGMQAEQHRLKGHRVLIGDDVSLRDQAEALGLDLSTALGEPLVVYRCLTCDEVFVHGTEEAYQRALTHQGHQIFVGEEKTVLGMSREPVTSPQTPNPIDPESVVGEGTLLSFGGDVERY